MRILFYNSVEGGSYWKRLLTEIGAAGHLVTHQHALSDSRLRNDLTLWNRFVRRWQTYPGYGLQILAGKGTADIHVACTNPFFAPALVQFLKSCQSPTVFLLYDLIPDGFELASLIKPNSLLSRIFAQFTRYALRHCSATVFLGKRLLDHAETRYGPCKYPVVIPVGADGSMFRNFPPVPPRSGQRIRILYCGNMGKAHDYKTVQKGFEEGLTGLDVEWHFHASGSHYRNLLNALSGNYDNDLCRFEGPLSDNDWFSAMASAHVALITMCLGAEKIIMPSKSYSALVAGQAILAICPRRSDLADLVYETNCGWVVEPGDVQGLSAAMEEIRSDPVLLQSKRENAFKAGHGFYDIGIIAKKWLELFTVIEENECSLKAK